MNGNKPTTEDNEEATQLLTYTVNKELINLNDRYLENCLLNLQENFVEKSQNLFLNEIFFPNLQLGKLIMLHSQMQEKFELMENDFEQILDIFQNHEEDFLIYCDIIPWLIRLQEFIKEKVSSNEEIREEIDKLTKESFRSSRNKDAQNSVEELLSRIPQTLMIFPMTLGSIAQEARKADKKIVEAKTKKAHKLMHKIMLISVWRRKRTLRLECCQMLMLGTESAQKAPFKPDL